MVNSNISNCYIFSIIFLRYFAYNSQTIIALTKTKTHLDTTSKKTFKKIMYYECQSLFIYKELVITN